MEDLGPYCSCFLPTSGLFSFLSPNSHLAKLEMTRDGGGAELPHMQRSVHHSRSQQPSTVAIGERRFGRERPSQLPGRPAVGYSLPVLGPGCSIFYSQGELQELSGAPLPDNLSLTSLSSTICFSNFLLNPFISILHLPVILLAVISHFVSS